MEADSLTAESLGPLSSILSKLRIILNKMCMVSLFATVSRP